MRILSPASATSTIRAGRSFEQIDDAGGLIAAEEDALAHMNADHQDAIELYATRLLGKYRERGAWLGSIPPVVSLVLGKTVRRLDFPHRVTAPDALRKTLVDLARKARSA